MGKIKLVSNGYLPKTLPTGGILMNDGEPIDFTNFAVEPEPCPECPECPEGGSYVYVPLNEGVIFDVKEGIITNNGAAFDALKAISFIQVIDAPLEMSVNASPDLDYKELINTIYYDGMGEEGIYWESDFSWNDDYVRNGVTVLKFDEDVADALDFDYYPSVEDALSHGATNIFTRGGAPS